MKHIDEFIEDLVDALNADGYKRGLDWNGFCVFEPIYNQEVCVGLPLVVLVKDGEARVSTDDEAMAYLHFAYASEDEDEED